MIVAMTTRQTILLLASTILGTLAAARPARACGYWFLEDVEQKVKVTFLARSIEALPQNAPPTATKKTLGWFLHESPRVCQRVRSNKLDVRDGEFRKGASVRARLAGNTLALGPHRFEIALQPITKPRQDLIPNLPYWDVTVTSDGKPIARGAAMSFSGCSEEGVEHKEAEIRERVGCYLVISRGASASSRK